MKRFSQLALSVGLIPFFAFGAKPIATITSAEPFALDGHSINTPGVSSFPVVVGDTLSTQSGSAVLMFPEGSTLKLGANSSVRIAGVETKPKIVLLGGALDYKLVPGSGLSVTNLDTEHKLANQAATPAHSAHPKSVLVGGNLETPAPPTPSPDANENSSNSRRAAAVQDRSGAAAPGAHPGLPTNSKFLIPAAGVAATGLAAGLLSLPPVSRHL